MLSAFGREYSHREGWSRSVRLFISVFGMIDLPTRIRARSVRQILREKDCECILDLGAGTGVYSYYLTRNPTCQVVAVDIDSDRVSVIRQIAEKLNRPRIQALQGGGALIATFPENGFSVVLAIESLQYFEDLDQVFSDCFRSLQNGGHFIAHVPIRQSLWPYERTLFNDRLLVNLFQSSGFEEVTLYRTFGSLHEKLCLLSTRCMKWPLLLAFLYPVLLLLITILPVFVSQGDYRLVVGRKPFKALNSAV